MQAEATYAIDGFETDKKPRLEEACHKNNGEFYKIINRNKNRSWLIDCRVNNELIEIEVPR